MGRTEEEDDDCGRRGEGEGRCWRRWDGGTLYLDVDGAVDDSNGKDREREGCGGRSEVMMGTSRVVMKMKMMAGGTGGSGNCTLGR